jgi:hypothetical protein
MDSTAEIDTSLCRKETKKSWINRLAHRKRKAKDPNDRTDHAGNHEGCSYEFAEITNQGNCNENGRRGQKENCNNSVFVWYFQLHYSHLRSRDDSAIPFTIIISNMY